MCQPLGAHKLERYDGARMQHATQHRSAGPRRAHARRSAEQIDETRGFERRRLRASRSRSSVVMLIERKWPVRRAIVRSTTTSAGRPTLQAVAKNKTRGPTVADVVHAGSINDSYARCRSVCVLFVLILINIGIGSCQRRSRGAAWIINSDCLPIYKLYFCASARDCECKVVVCAFAFCSTVERHANNDTPLACAKTCVVYLLNIPGGVFMC